MWECMLFVWKNEYGCSHVNEGMNTNKALFLDRDGVINHRIVGGYVRNQHEFILQSEIIPLLRAARQMGYLLILVSNQQGVGKGVMTLEELEHVHEYMQEVLASELDGKGLDDINYCTELASANSIRRKPAPGMLLEAISEHSLDPTLCWFIGDSVSDAQAGRAAGVHTVLIGEHPAESADVIIPHHSGLLALIDLF